MVQLSISPAVPQIGQPVTITMEGNTCDELLIVRVRLGGQTLEDWGTRKARSTFLFTPTNSGAYTVEAICDRQVVASVTFQAT